MILVPRLIQSSCHTFFPGIMALKDYDHVNVTTEDGSDPLTFSEAMLVRENKTEHGYNFEEEDTTEMCSIPGTCVGGGIHCG